jgi:hypothetical protein
MSSAEASTAAAIRVRNMSYAPGTVRGYLRMDGNTGAGGTAVPALVATVPMPGLLRITGPVGGYDFGTPASGMLGSTLWGVRITGLGTNNTGTWRYLDSGVSGGAYWIEVHCPTATATSVGAGVASLVTAKMANGQTYHDAIRPMGLQALGTRTGDAVFDWVMESTPLVQSFQVANGEQTRLLIENVRDDGSGLAFSVAGVDFIDSVFRNITNTGQLATTGATFDSCEVINCVFGSAVGGFTGPNSLIDRNHWIAGTSFGTNATTGSWFAASPLVSFEPSAPNIGTGRELTNEPASWAWNALLPTRGAMRNSANDNWNPSESIADLSVSVAASITATAVLRIQGTMAGSVSPIIELVATTSVGAGTVGDLAGTVSATSTMAGSLGAIPPVVGTLAGTVSATSSLTGTPRIGGILAGTVAATSSLTGFLTPLEVDGVLAGSVSATSALTANITPTTQGVLAASVSVTAEITGMTATLTRFDVRGLIRSALGWRRRGSRRPFWLRYWR